jgi:GrpB-like predicted nucleotidyltransferase (UPF0157 family)
MSATKRRIEILPFQTRWHDEFRAAAGALRASLGGLALRIDHIGSTAVPGLGAKDVIDVQVTVAELAPAEALLAAFAAGGYTLRGPQGDHRPPGDTRAEAEWHKLYLREPEGGRRTHIHVRQAGRANQRYALLFRDFLRADASAAAAYEQAKRALARLHPFDIDAYLDVKEPICDLVMGGAERWATAVAWAPGDADA